MTFSYPSILIVGGNSAIARNLLDLVPTARAIARKGGGGRVTAIGDYHDIRPDDLDGIHTVINCAGVVNGTQAELQRVNVELQAYLATTAREAGVSRYIAISSFSIFGPQTTISIETPISANSAYARSKLDGDEALQRLRTLRFRPLSVALPAIIGTTRPGKVEHMLRLWRHTGLWMMPAGDVARSMIGAQCAARVLAHAATDDRTGRILAADPIPFGYHTVAQWLGDELGRKYALHPLSPSNVALIKRLCPPIYRSMMSDSMLAPEANYAIECGLESSLRSELINAVTQGNSRK